MRLLRRASPAPPFTLSETLPSTAAAGSPAARFLFAVADGCADAGGGPAKSLAAGLPPALQRTPVTAP